MWRAMLLATLAAFPAAAETLVPTRTIRAQDIIAPEDLTVIARNTPGALSDPLRSSFWPFLKSLI